MFSLSRRQAHAAVAGLVTAAGYLAAAEVGSKKPVRVGGLFVLSTLAMSGVVGGILSSKSTAKSLVTEARLNNFFSNGGAVGGDFQVNGAHTVTGSQTVQGSSTTQGNHTVQGTLLGSGGTIDVGDHLNMSGNNVNSIDTLDSFSGALQVSSSSQLTVLSNSGVHTNGGFFGNTTGDSHAGTAPSSYNTPYIQSLANRINDILSAIG